MAFQVRVPEGHDVKVTPTESEKDAELRRKKDLEFFRVCLIFLIIIVFLAVYFIFSSDSDAKSWARVVISSVLSGMFGYLLKR
jgi:RsiW-degrading membrane proteinase PrsW (M82 family)